MNFKRKITMKKTQTLEAPSSQSSKAMLRRWLEQYRQNPLAAIRDSDEAFASAVERALQLLKERGYNTEIGHYYWLRDAAKTMNYPELGKQVPLKGHSL